MSVLTIVAADIDQAQCDALVAAYGELLTGDRPDGLIETRLLGDGQGHWAIHTLWRDREALDAMRGSGEPPAAPALFRRFGAQPSLTVMDVVSSSAG